MDYILSLLIMNYFHIEIIDNNFELFSSTHQHADEFKCEVYFRDALHL